MTDWTLEQVADRFAEAADTGHRLPPVRVQGYFNLWPPYNRQVWEGFAERDYDLHPLPPAPAAIDRMLETIEWLVCLGEDDLRHLIWMRADRYDWKFICRRIGCDRTTAWRRWTKALETIAGRLNGKKSGDENKY
ncbi:DUF6362 domain-containing protein [Gammaproteobacteria bacterium]